MLLSRVKHTPPTGTQHEVQLLRRALAPNANKQNREPVTMNYSSRHPWSFTMLAEADGTRSPTTSGGPQAPHPCTKQHWARWTNSLTSFVCSYEISIYLQWPQSGKPVPCTQILPCGQWECTTSFLPLPTAILYQGMMWTSHEFLKQFATQLEGEVEGYDEFNTKEMVICVSGLIRLWQIVLSLLSHN